MPEDDGRGEARTDRVDRSVISVPLLERLQAHDDGDAAAAAREPWFHVVVDLDYTYPGGVDPAARKVTWMLRACAALAGRRSATADGAAARDALRIDVRGQFVFAYVPASVVEAVAALDRTPPDDTTWQALRAAGPFPIARKHFARRAVHRIWPDFETRALRRA